MSKSLTLGRLSEYDDLLTDHLIDKVYFWTKTHKTDRHKNHSSRNVKTKEVVDILQQHVIGSKGKLGNAVDAFLALPSVDLFNKRLNEAQKKDFVKHVRKYLCIYLPQAGFEICSTNRYPGPKTESCVIANKTFKTGEVLKFLAGTIVAMTEEEEDYYEAEHDFSILHSSRLDSMCLFLGPARFVNHDCEPNGAFVTQGASIAITTIKSVRIGEEITVFYSPDYFGPNNIDCLCASCESKGLGGYRDKDPQCSQALMNNADMANELKTDSVLIQQQEEPQNKKTNYVHTIEMDTKPGSDNTMIRLKGQLMTPPNSELSVEELTRSLGWVNEDSDQYDDKDYADSFPSDEEDEDDIHIKLETSDSDSDLVKPDHSEYSYNQEAITHDIGHMLAPGNNMDMSTIVPKVLRPRRAVHDYNLKRQSLLSINPILDNDGLRNRRLRRDRKLDVDYCSVCDEELPFEAIVEEIWSVTEAVGVKDVLCKRCERHAKLYQGPWPKRTPLQQVPPGDNTRLLVTKVSRETTPLQCTSSLSCKTGISSVSPTKKHMFTNTDQRECNSEGPADRSCALPLIELAKARMKKGNINVPRLARLHKLQLRDNKSHSTKDRSLTSYHKIPVPTYPWNDARNPESIIPRTYPACLACRRLKQRCSRVESGASTCERCHRLQKSCLIDDDAMVLDHQVSAESTSRPQAGVLVITSPGRVLSPDSLVAALQVRSPRKIQHMVEGDTFSEGKEFDPEALNPNYSIAKTQTETKELESSLSTVAKSADLQIADVKPVKIERSARERRRSTKGSWYYVDVNSSDSAEDVPEILACRTRRQERALSSVADPQPLKTYIELDSSDDDQPELFVYKPPEKRSGPSKRKRRTPTWDYISIDSDEELEKVYTTDEPRAARRKATVQYKE